MYRSAVLVRRGLGCCQRGAEDRLAIDGAVWFSGYVQTPVKWAHCRRRHGGAAALGCGAQGGWDQAVPDAVRLQGLPVRGEGYALPLRQRPRDGGRRCQCAPLPTEPSAAGSAEACGLVAGMPRTTRGKQSATGSPSRSRKSAGAPRARRAWGAGSKPQPGAAPPPPAPTGRDGGC